MARFTPMAFAASGGECLLRQAHEQRYFLYAYAYFYQSLHACRRRQRQEGEWRVVKEVVAWLWPPQLSDTDDEAVEDEAADVGVAVAEEDEPLPRLPPALTRLRHSPLTLVYILELFKLSAASALGLRASLLTDLVHHLSEEHDTDDGRTDCSEEEEEQQQHEKEEEDDEDKEIVKARETAAWEAMTPELRSDLRFHRRVHRLLRAKVFALPPPHFRATNY